MTQKEMYFTMYCSVAQGILEAKGGVIGEIVPPVLAEESILVTDALMEKFNKKFNNE